MKSGRGGILASVPPLTPSSVPPEPQSGNKRGISLPVVFGIVILVALIAGGAYFVSQTGSDYTGAITLTVQEGVGPKTIKSLALGSGTLTPVVVTDAVAMGARPSTSYALENGSVISLAPSGIVLTQDGEDGSTTVLVAAAVPPNAKTPLAVSRDGSRIAWVNPADQSLQVFERNSRNSYAPIYLDTEVKIDSLGFTHNGSILAFAVVHVERAGAVTTDINAVDLANQTSSEKPLATISGFARIITSP